MRRFAYTTPRPKLDATRLLPGLAQGSLPKNAKDVWDAGYTTVVFCAKELQPDASLLPGIRVLRCPLVDEATPVSPSDWQKIARCATAIAAIVRSGQRVLVTCAEGRNRSGLVNAISLHILTGATGSQAVEYIQRRRKNALTNPEFIRALVRRLR